MESRCSWGRMESNARIQVAYATRYGAAEGISRDIAEGLKQVGLEAEARPVGEVFDLAGYRAIVLGSPVYAGNCRPAWKHPVRGSRP